MSEKEIQELRKCQMNDRLSETDEICENGSN